MALSKLERRARIKRRIRKIVFGTATKPRLSVYRSNKEIYAQLVDDVNGVTLASVSSRDKEIEANGGYGPPDKSKQHLHKIGYNRRSTYDSINDRLYAADLKMTLITLFFILVPSLILIYVVIWQCSDKELSSYQ